MKEDHNSRPNQHLSNTRIKSFGLENFRVFKDYTNFELKPFTILTGANNTGKSSLNKALLLMKQNQNNLNNGTFGFLNYFGGEHDLGNHELVKNIPDENTFFYFTFQQKYQIAIEVSPNGEILGDYCISKESNPVISQSGGAILFNYDNLIEYFRLRVKHENIEEPEKLKHFISKLEEEANKGFHSVNIDLYDHFWIYQEGIGENEYRFRQAELKDKFNEFKKKGVFSTFFELNSSDMDSKYKYVDEDVLDLDLCFSLIFLFNKLTGIKLTEKEVCALIPNVFIRESLSSANTKPIISFDGLNYIPTIKEQLKRSYLFSDKSQINTLITRNINQTNYWKSNSSRRTINLRQKRQKNEFDFLNAINEFAEKWLQEFDIGEKLDYGYNEDTDTFFMKIDDKYLPEYGFGYSQILYLIFTLHNEITPSGSDSIFYFPRTYIIEEPETGLHPAFQSKIAEMIIDAHKTFGVNFIIETHSEYFIRKLQLLTANKTIKSEDSIIYYFNNPKYLRENEKLVKEITIDEYGGLSDSFGKGFIDEATGLKFELINLNKKQRN